MKFRKKPVVVDAVRFWNGNGPSSITECLNFIGKQKADMDEETGELWIYTPEGVMRASDGDWIIKGVEGEFYPCKPGIFAVTYEPVEEKE